MTDHEARAVPVGWALLDNGEAEPIDRSGRAVPVEGDRERLAAVVSRWALDDTCLRGQVEEFIDDIIEARAAPVASDFVAFVEPLLGMLSAPPSSTSGTDLPEYADDEYNGRIPGR